MTQKKSKESLLIQYNQKKGTARVVAEKRVLSRLDVNKNIFVGREGTFQKASLVNLSGSGALIEVKLDLQKHQIIELKLETMALPFAKAEVMRIAKKGCEYGVRWLELYEDQLPKGFLTKVKM